ncbi:hypothetical protein HGT70_14385 [Rosenbergiella collisarenosi]|uniref:hypothetical protein n=1 Tax=Rosenbergiella collisarenosi TaxID=1544695 RepID=UPI001BDAF730|nr:hypothetical protein [Rosenbergiella collisarenosi]MBT0722462.1 hypothetical protein [Rosenbergiella collisarenosi]
MKFNVIGLLFALSFQVYAQNPQYCGGSEITSSVQATEQSKIAQRSPSSLQERMNSLSNHPESSQPVACNSDIQPAQGKNAVTFDTEHVKRTPYCVYASLIYGNGAVVSDKKGTELRCNVTVDKEGWHSATWVPLK